MIVAISVATVLLGQAVDLNSLVDQFVGAYSVGVLILLVLQLSGQTKSKPKKKVFTAKIHSSDDELISSNSASQNSAAATRGPPDTDQLLPSLSGSWKMTGSEGTSEFLMWCGAGWGARQAICAQRSTHVLTYNAEENTVRIQIDGILPQDYTYVLGGAPLNTKLRTTAYEDSLYLENEALVLKKHRLKDGVIFYNSRVLVDGAHMTLTSVGHGPKGTIEQRQFFVRQD